MGDHGTGEEGTYCGRVVTTTTGFAAFRSLGDLPVDKLGAAADASLLRAKVNGRKRVEGEAPLVRPARVSAQRWQRFAPVFADPWFADRIPDFLMEVRDETRAMLDSRRGGEMDRVRFVAEGLRNQAMDLGLEVSRLVGDLDHADSEYVS